MGKFWLGLLLFFALAGGIFYKYFFDKTIFSKGTINFSVQEFGNGDLVPKKFTCDGQDVSPSFLIERVPGDAKSLVIFLEDIDKPASLTNSSFTHYILFNIDPEVSSIDQNTSPAGAIIGTNDFDKDEYNGPCPSIGSHKYVFKVFALDKELSLDKNARRVDVDTAIKGHIIAKGEYNAEYSKI